MREELIYREIRYGFANTIAVCSFCQYNSSLQFLHGTIIPLSHSMTIYGHDMVVYSLSHVALG